MDELTRTLHALADAMGVLVWAAIGALTLALLHAAPILVLPFAAGVAWWWSKRPR
jgi:hypothetical protein